MDSHGRNDIGTGSWTADFDIARRSLLIAPPAEYTDGMDLENTVTIQSDDKPILSQEYYVLDFTHPEARSSS